MFLRAQTFCESYAKTTLNPKDAEAFFCCMNAVLLQRCPKEGEFCYGKKLHPQTDETDGGGGKAEGRRIKTGGIGKSAAGALHRGEPDRKRPPGGSKPDGAKGPDGGLKVMV